MYMRAVTPPPDEHLLPVTVVGGDEGTGKTTLLRHLLTHNAGRSLAVVVDDVRTIGLDSRLIAHRDGALLKLTNGCYLCSMDGDVSSALAALRSYVTRPTHVLLEARGATPMRRVAGYGYMPGYRMGGIVVVADADAIRDRLSSPEHGEHLMNQLTSAEILVVNKVDLLVARSYASLREWLTGVLPRVRTIETSHGRVASPLLLGLAPEEAERDARTMASTWETTFRTPGRERAHSSDDGELGPPYRVWTLATPEPVRAIDFRAWGARLPQTVVRGSGVVHIREDPHYRYLFEMVGHHNHLQREQPWGHASPETRLAFVGL
jgi:G3E family GTPase